MIGDEEVAPHVSPPPPTRMYLRRVRLNQGGYDSDGRYWGVDQPLYYYMDDGDVSDYIRAYDREHAKEKIHRKHPGHFKKNKKEVAR